MDRAIRKLFYVFVAMFVGLILMLTYVQVWAAPSLKINPANTRAVEEEMKIKRGVIVSADGKTLATNDQDGQYFLRRYPYGDLTEPWLGYNNLTYGRAGVERVYNEELTGQAGLLGVTSSWNVILGKDKRGSDLTLTINMAVQQAAAQALGKRRGAVVALDPKTGAILAMVSYPRYDPNTLTEEWKELVNDEGRPLLNRATQGLYPPGSTFKIIVGAAGLQSGAVTPTSTFDDKGSINLGGYVIHNFDPDPYGEHDFTKAFASSINTTFASLGVQMGADTLASYAKAFGFDTALPWKFGGATSRFPAASSMDKAHVAQASIGQGEVLSTPLLMGLAACAVANEGVIMKPYLVSEVRSYSNRLVEKTEPGEWLRPMQAATAATVKGLMVEAVRKGTGTAAAISGVQVAGKTGTAQVATGEPHAWFAGFAPADDPKVAVVVLVENAGSGGTVAAPIAKQVMAAALGR